MKIELEDKWFRYRCDGPLCNPNISNVKEFLITPDSTFCQIEIPTDETMRDKTISVNRKPDIVDYGWRRIVRDEKISHICPKCMGEFTKRLARKLNQFMQTVDRHDLPTIARIAEICSSPYLYEDLSKDDYI